jgi:hypothetical protein
MGATDNRMLGYPYDWILVNISDNSRKITGLGSDGIQFQILDPIHICTKMTKFSSQ